MTRPSTAVPLLALLGACDLTEADGSLSDLEAIAEAPAPGLQPKQPPPPGGKRVCFNLKVSYIDAGFGEDYENMPASGGVPAVQSQPAAFLRASVIRDGKTVWTGNLNSLGCTPSLSLSGGNMIVVRSLVERQVGPGENDLIRFHIYSADSTKKEWKRFFRVGSASTIHVSPDTWDTMQNVAGVASRIASTLDDWLKVDNVPIKVGVKCPREGPPLDEGSDGSCFWSTQVFLAPESSAGPAHALSKFHIAHQIGHSQLATTFEHSPSFTFTDATHALCRCEQIEDGMGNYQCTQSLEKYDDALDEGFAHFFASAAYNDRDHSDCQFVDYRPLSILFGVIDPPAPIDCAASFAWRDTYCDDEPATATSLDFMRFFWRLYAVGPDRLSAATIKEIVHAATFLGPLDFAGLSLAAEDVLGPGSPEWQNFVDLAADVSVD
jgi:hypothetical protein